MAEEKESTKSKFIKLQNLLSSETKSETTVNILETLLDFFKTVHILEEKIVKNQVYDELRDTVKTIFTYLQKVKVPTTQTQKRIEELIRDILVAISNFCSAYYCLYHPYGCGEMIKEFLSSQCRLFIPDFGAAPTSILEKDKTEQQIDTTKWIWAKESSFKTLFFCQCIQTIMLNLCKFEQKFQEMQIPVIGQYLRLLYYMDDYLVHDNFITLCINHIDLLSKIFSSPSKEIMKDATKEKLEEISEYLLKLLRFNKNDALKKRIQLLGPLLGITMMKMNSIEKKILGCKIVSKFSYQMLYRSTSYISQNSYAQWIFEHNFFQTIFEDNCQTSLVKSSEDTFKLLIKRGQLKTQQFKRFFEILEKAEADLRKAMFRLIDPFRVDYYQIEAMLQIFSNIRGAEFYDDQFFYFMQGLSRYSTQKQLIRMISITEAIIQQNYSKFESYLTRRRSVECYSYIFQRLITYKDINERIDAYVKAAENFIEDPTQNKLIILKTLFQGLSQYKMEKNYQETLCSKIIINVQFIEKSLKYAKQIKFREDLISTIKTILKKYGSSINKVPFSQNTLIETVDFPEIFEEMLKTITNSEQFSLKDLFDKLSSLSAIKDFSFACLKHVFIRLNWKTLRPIKKEYTDLIGTYATYVNPQEFVGVDTLKYLIFNSAKAPIRQGACQLLVQIYTNLADDFREEGELYLIEFMKNILKVIEHKLKNFFEADQPLISVLGSLQLMEDLMLNTEYFGVGSLKAHNSLIPTSTVNLKVFNNCSYRDDVLKIFQKKFPSNKTLFQLIVEVSKQFKMGPLDMCFQYPTGEMIRYNGLTLEELKLNCQEINAIKLPQSRLKKEPMLIDGKLSPKAIKAFTEMFNKFAPDGKMTAKQCAAYIDGVTLSFCPIFDSRINSLFAEYDTDKDKVLTLDDFLRFYFDSIVDPEKAETVDKNLSNLGYRRDLRLYDDDLDNLNEQVLFRYHIWQNQDIYQYLFKLSHHDDLQLAALSKVLILRLPTYPKIVESLSDSFDLKNKNPFEVEYLLTALRSQIDKQQGFSSKLINSNNHLAIFEYLSELCSKQVKSENENNCLIICLYLLQSLLGLKHTGKDILKEFPKLAFSLPETDVFVKIMKENIKKGDSTLLEPTLSLQLTQSSMSLDWIQQAVFNKDKDIRVDTTGFLLLWTLKNHNKDVDLFKIKINPHNNQQWFNLLTMLVNLDQSIDYSDIFRSKLQEITSCSESLEQNRFNPIIHGNLKIIQEMYKHLKPQQKHELTGILHQLLPSLISNQNRELVYSLILRHSPASLIDTLEKIANVTMGKETQPRNQYVGIRNLGCICYMNSILQQFFMINQFKSLIMSLEPNQQQSEVNGITIIDDFLYQLQKMYISLEWSQKQYYDPSTFCLAIKDSQGKPINTHIQEDAHEFLNTAFDKLEGYSKKQNKLKSLQRIFGGKTVTEIICQTCKNKNEVLEHYYHLTLEVKGMKTLKDSFDKMIIPEEISDYFCVNCDKKVEKITKQTLIKEAPEILIINLQRIVFDLESFLKVKVHTKLQFQHVLDLHSYFSSSSKPAPYNLKGVVIHSGTSEGGHYYSLIKQDSKWYKFNDQSVSLFNELDIGREAFGGDEHTDTLGDLTSSTNAYILIYERVKSNQEVEQPQQFSSVVEKLKGDILQENKNFQSQLQLYQPSYFDSLNTLFTLESTSIEKEKLQKLFNVHLKIVQHLCINSDVKTQIINQIKDNFLKLYSLLPEKANEILEKISKSTFGQIICTHNDVNIREIYQKILVKSLLTVIESTQQLSENVREMLNYIFDLLEDDLVLKNVYKSYQYFELWKQLISNKRIRGMMEERNSLEHFLDLLMGSDSDKSIKDKKRPDFNMSEAMPLVPIVISLLQTKLNLVGKRPNQNLDEKYSPLTDLEQSIFNNQNFYRKMMKNKLDMGLLSPIISLLCYQDEKYSKFIVQILIKAMNNADEIEDKNVVFQNIKAFFLVEDYLTSQRMKWGLGISQLDSVTFIDQEFGMMTSPESKVVSYVSSYLFQKDEKCVPLLYSLFQKRKFFNSFSVHGVIMFLQLIRDSEQISEYILSLPAPTYIHKTYIDWIQSFITRVKIEDHYGLPYDKKILSEKLQGLFQQVKDKMKQSPLFHNLPVNKYIIGKNAQKLLKGTLDQPEYTIQMWAHQTYVLMNKPYGYGNFSLPDTQFSFASTAQPKTAKYFLKSVVVLEEESQEKCQVEKQLTVLSFNVKNSVSLVINFNVEGFRHKIYLKHGEHVINCPYTMGEISELIAIEKGQEAGEVLPEVKMNLQDFSNEHRDYAAPTPSLMNYNFNCFSEEVNCKVCTYLNFGRQICEMCGADLFK